MFSVVLVVHLLILLALIAVVLLQRSEGGALGIGGGGGGGLMTGRGAANALTRTTAILAAGFFITSIALSVLSGVKTRSPSILDKVNESPADESAPAVPEIPAVPAPAVPAPSVPTPQ